jgi:hypothetical protein
MIDVLEHCPSSDVISAAEAEDPQFPGIYSVHVGDYDLRMAPSFNCLDPRVPDEAILRNLGLYSGIFV